MSISITMKKHLNRLQAFRMPGRKKIKVQQLKIGNPYNFRKETSNMPGLPEEQVDLLREKTAAGRVGVVEHRRPSATPSETSGHTSLNYHPIHPGSPTSTVGSGFI